MTAVRSSPLCPLASSAAGCTRRGRRGSVAGIGLLAVLLLGAGPAGSLPAGDGAPPVARPATEETRNLREPLRREWMDAAAAYSQSKGGRAVVVQQGGTRIYERYIQGWNGDRPHPLASGTKSFSGTLAACAIEDGLIASLDERVSDTIIEWKDDPRKREITVRHLLTLASGLQPQHDSLGKQGFGIEGIAEPRDGPIARKLRERAAADKPGDRFAAAVRIPTECDPGTRFHYGPAHFYAFGEFLERKLKASSRPERSYFDYLRARVLLPCGIDIGLDRFGPDAANKPGLPGSGHLSANEWIRFGEMIRLGGVVPSVGSDGTAGERRVMKAESIALCMTPSATNPAYGLTWWIFTGQTSTATAMADSGGRERRQLGERVREGGGTGATVTDGAGTPVRVWMAAGAGGQRLYVLPDADLVVVRFAELGKEGQSYDDVQFLRTLLGVGMPAR